MEKQLFTDKELAPILGCSWRHVKTLRLKRLIPHVKLGRLIRYNPQEVMRAIEKITVREHDLRTAKIRNLEEGKRLEHNYQAARFRNLKEGEQLEYERKQLLSSGEKKRLGL